MITCLAMSPLTRSREYRCESSRCRGLAPRLRFAAWVVLSCVSAAAIADTGLLNDTGIVKFATNTSNTLATEPSDFPGQDARIGRDAQAAAGQLTKVGSGPAGFDFTKIANNGAELPQTAPPGPGPTDWACTRDNVTGLLWELKTPSGLRSRSHTYTYYNSDPKTNGGNAGVQSGGSCETPGRCDTEKFVQDVNATGVCGRRDWRRAEVEEELSAVNFGIDLNDNSGTIGNPLGSLILPLTSQTVECPSTVEESVSGGAVLILGFTSGQPVETPRCIHLVTDALPNVLLP